LGNFSEDRQPRKIKAPRLHGVELTEYCPIADTDMKDGPGAAEITRPKRGSVRVQIEGKKKGARRNRIGLDYSAGAVQPQHVAGVGNKRPAIGQEPEREAFAAQTVGEIRKLSVGRRVEPPDRSTLGGIEDGVLIRREVDPIGAARSYRYGEGVEQSTGGGKFSDDVSPGAPT